MKDAAQLGFDGRYAKLDPVIRRVYNLPLMGRLAIGSGWEELSAEQRQAFLDAFSKYSVATYAARFDGYSGERFEVDPQPSPAAGGVIVNSKLVKSDGEPVVLNYLMRGADATWQIIDVYLTGTISQLATQRSEFTAVLRRDGAQALVDLLNRRVEDMRKPP
jgi:phospholipid transport system substrate-binding protein